MRFEVKYSGYGDIHIFGFRKPIHLNIHGKGFINLSENALVLQGSMLKFEVPLIYFCYKKVLYIPTTRTLPYSTILKYKKPGLCRRRHEITYRLPGEKKCVFKFKITKYSRSNNKLFANQFKEYLTVAKSFSAS